MLAPIVGYEVEMEKRIGFRRARRPAERGKTSLKSLPIQALQHGFRKVEIFPGRHPPAMNEYDHLFGAFGKRWRMNDLKTARPIFLHHLRPVLLDIRNDHL